MTLSHRNGYIKPSDCNGCGTGWSADIIPNTIYLLSIKDVCCIHDDRYETGKTIEDKKSADREFLNNMIRIIEADTRWYYPTFFARQRAIKYYEAVKYFGGSAFWDKK